MLSAHLSAASPIQIPRSCNLSIQISNGSLKNIKAHSLGSVVIKDILKKSKINQDEIDEVIMGQVLTAGTGQNPARQAAVNAGIPITKPSHIVNQVCGSGLRAVISGYQSIRLGEVKKVISGGQEKN